MKVLHVIWDLGQGGAQAYLANLVRFNEGEDLLVDVAVLTGPGVFSSAVKEYVQQLTYIGMRNGFDILGAIRLYFFVRSAKPDVIHIHTNSIAALASCVLTNVPIVYTEHGVGVMRGYRRGVLIEKLLYKVFYRWVSCFVAVSETMRKKMIAANSRVVSRIVVVPNGIDYDQLQNASLSKKYPKQLQEDNVFKIGAVARLTRVKGLDLFIRVVAEVKQQYRDVAFFLVGDGELRGELEALASELAVTNCVYFLGYRDDVFALVKNFDLYLMTSHFESFGLTLIEAMAAGVPVVAAKAEGAFDEIIENGVDGILVGSRDPRLIADVIVRLLKDEPRRIGMGAAAKEKVKYKFSMANNARAIMTCYKSVLALQRV